MFPSEIFQTAQSYCRILDLPQPFLEKLQFGIEIRTKIAGQYGSKNIEGISQFFASDPELVEPVRLAIDFVGQRPE